MLALNFSPFPILYTKRLCLRRIVKEDAQTFFDMRTNEQIMKYIDRPRPSSIADIELLIQKIDTNIKDNFAITWTITTREDNNMIGNIGFHRIDFENYRAEVGYILSPAYWKAGYMSECLQTVLSFGFHQLQFHSIEAIINPANNASRQLLEKHDFKQEGYFKENHFFNGQFLDSEVYSLLNTYTAKGIKQ